MLRSIRYLFGFGLVGTFAALGCTFGGLADYDVGQCDPSKSSQVLDECDRLNGGDSENCMPFQCDPGTRQCVRKVRDDDRDGDPAIRCGGSDCVDTDAAQSSRAQEICDLKDNDCDSLIDEDAIKPGVGRVIQTAGSLGQESDPSFSSTANGFLATYILKLGEAGTCLPLIPLNRNSTGQLGTGCAILNAERTLAPRQPFVAPVGGGFGAAFIATSGCVSGRLAYRFQTSSPIAAELGCDAAHPAALPTLGLLTGGNTIPGFVAWYEVSPAERGEPTSTCETAKPARLMLLQIPDLKDTNAVKGAFTAAKAQELSPAALSLRTPAFVAAGADTLLLASPAGSNVAVWAFPRSFAAGSAVPKPIELSGLADARSVAINTANDGATTRVAVSAEIGCYPKQSIKVALGSVAAGGALSFEKVIEVAKDLEIATQPAVAWMPQRGGEWWVSWIDKSFKAGLQRYRADGSPVGGTIQLGTQIVLGAVAYGDDFPAYYAFDQKQADGAFVEIPLGCGG